MQQLQQQQRAVAAAVSRQKVSSKQAVYAPSVWRLTLLALRISHPQGAAVAAVAAALAAGAAASSRRAMSASIILRWPSERPSSC